MKMSDKELEKTNVKVEFSIYGDDFNPDRITKRLNINPEKVWRKGEQVGKHNILRKENCWMISTGYQESLDINNQLYLILQLLQSVKEELMALKNEIMADFKIDIVINIEDNQTPAMYLDNEVIHFCNDFDITLDFDLYIM